MQLNYGWLIMVHPNQHTHVWRHIMPMTNKWECNSLNCIHTLSAGAQVLDWGSYYAVLYIRVSVAWKLCEVCVSHFFFSQSRLKRMADSFKNCSGFTDGELKGLALYRGITSIILCVSLFIMLVSILISAKCCCFRTLCGTFLKRFAIGLTAVSMLCLLFYATQMNNFVDLQDQKFCEAVGFLVMYTGSVQLLLTVGTSLVFFIKVWKALTFVTLLDTLCRRCENQTFTCRGLRVNILEIVFYVSVVGIPLLLDWIPFITNSYGPTVAWCWIRKYESDCSTHIAGLVEGLLFWDAPSLRWCQRSVACDNQHQIVIWTGKVSESMKSEV